ncbi:MAG TPA: hypothetical protein VN643_17845 [Pyrinomonadaceae bacterium]|nr:hypothetical protein [Pyrinomonadaceae bacterium]
MTAAIPRALLSTKWRTLHWFASVAFLVLATTFSVAAQSQKLPSPEKIVEAHLKAIGGKKNVAAVRSATYEWKSQLKGQADGTSRWRVKAPGSARFENSVGSDLITAANTSSAWVLQGPSMRTLIGAEAAAAKLRAFLDASRLVDYKKANVLARFVSVGDIGSEPSYIVEFSRRGGSKLTYWFSLKTKLLVKVIDDNTRTTTRFEDYRRVGNILEPHRVRISNPDSDLVLELQNVVHNSLIADSVFDPPAAVTAVDVVSLMRAVGRNQDEVEKRVNEYSFVQKETEREINGRGELKKETVKVYEVFPIAHQEPVMKLISENGVALTGEKAAKEEKRVIEELEKAERDQDKNQQKAERRKEERRKKAGKGHEDEEPGISQFLMVCEFVSPRHESFRGRDAVVFDFRPRPGFKPANRAESLISKLVGVVWIDPADKQVMRLEARLAEGFKMGGGLLLSVRPGAAVVMEQTRMVEGVWLPSFAQVNLSVKVLLFGGGDINQTVEWSDYRHFAGKVHDYKLDYPKAENQAEKKP